ncbi:hypothetical protein [Haliangium ochraceum]|uniref:hypothetical protein n=1 Tax=Haliangium ochraceum TaxID=80816 RepID=UPI00019BAE18|nr:hypothetical protein [Haliangium ochraceum]
MRSSHGSDRQAPGDGAFLARSSDIVEFPETRIAVLDPAKTGTAASLVARAPGTGL